MKHLMNNEISIYSESTKDKFGQITFGSATIVDGRFEYKSKVIYNEAGDETMADAIAYLPSDTTISLQDKLSFESVDYQVLRLDKPKKARNVDHIKVYLGSLA